VTNIAQPRTALREKVLSGLRWSAGLRFLGQLLTWAITIVVMRKLSPQDYGLLGMAFVFITYLAAINELGLGAALIQRKTLDDRMIRQIFGFLLILNIGLFLLCYFLAPIISSFFDEKRLVSIIRLLATQFILSSFVIIPESLIDRDMLFRQKSVVDLVAAMSGSLTTLVLAFAGWGVWSLVWGTLTLNIFRTSGLNVVKPCIFMPSFSLNKIRQAISFGGYVTLTRILWMFYSQSDILIVGKLLGKQLLGFYSIAMTLASLPMEKVSGLINQVAFPAFATIQGDTQQAAKHLLKAVRVMSLIAFPVLWGISSVAPPLVQVLIGKSWDVAIVPLQIISLVIPIRMVSNLISPTLLGLGRPEVNLYNVITASILLPSGFLVGSYWGIIGVSLSWATVFPIVFLINLSRLTRILKIRLLSVLCAILKPLSASVVMYIAVSIVNFHVSGFDAILRLALPALAGTVVYFGTILLLDLEGCNEMFSLLRK
jgi:teichuronic acid exporter